MSDVLVWLTLATVLVPIVIAGALAWRACKRDDQAWARYFNDRYGDAPDDLKRHL